MDFNTALEFVLDLEGRTFTNHPLDLGGPTFWGITQSTYDGYCHYRNLPHRLVQTLNPKEIAEIYRSEFWNLPQDNAGTPIVTLLPSPADAVFFQLVVNLGGKMATKLLQSAINAEPDGAFGPVSREALKNSTGLLGGLLIAQLAHYATVEEAWDAEGLYGRVQKVRAWITKVTQPASKSTSRSSSQSSPSGSPSPAAQ